MIAKRI